MHLLDKVSLWLAQEDVQAYLVGGCVRDQVLGRPVRDLDVVVADGALGLARRLADQLRGAYYTLDQERGTGRVVIKARRGTVLVVDVSQFRGEGLTADLAARDFTINALAVDLHAPSVVIDPHGGLADLRARVLRPVSEASIRDDPVRSLRAVRLAAELGLTIAPEAEALIRRDGAGLQSTSGERIRDELVRLVELPGGGPSLNRLDGLGLLCVVFPELEPLRGALKPPPHHLDALAHSLATVDELERLLEGFAARAESQADRPGAGGSRDPILDSLLGKFGDRIQAHVVRKLGDERPRRATLKLAALLHDVGKPGARTADEQGRIRYSGHDLDGAQIAADALGRLRLSGQEIGLAKAIVRNHMRPLLLAKQDDVSAHAVYRFFRDAGEAGVEVLIHSLADQRATVLRGSPDDQWPRLVGLVARMLTDFWERTAERVSPPRLVDGTVLQHEFDLAPGPRIGELLEVVREAQVSGQVQTRAEALELVRRRLLDCR